MKREAISDVFVLNQEIHSIEHTDMFDQIRGSSIYEVIKIMDGVPLFAGEHIGRMKHSAALSGSAIPMNADEIITQIAMLVEHTQHKNINVKLVWSQSRGKDLFLTYFIRPEYPGRQAYLLGVHTILFQGERETPHMKTISSSFRERVREARKKSGAYEALLVNEVGYVTEGTRSNIFFLKEGKIYTPPAEAVLLGVTRRHVVEICETLEIEVREENLHQKELSELEGAFITGTTVDVLPIGSIDDRPIPSASEPRIQKIVACYAEGMKACVRQFKQQE